MPLQAVRRTRVTLAAARTILSGSYRVHSILISNSTGAAVDVEFTNTDDEAEASITVGADTSFDWTLTQIFDNGLKVGAISSGVVVTVAHSQDGV